MSTKFFYVLSSVVCLASCVAPPDDQAGDEEEVGTLEDGSDVACGYVKSGVQDGAPVQTAASGSPSGADRIAWARPTVFTSTAPFSGSAGNAAAHEGIDYIHDDSAVTKVNVRAAAAGVVAYVRVGCPESSAFGVNTSARECGAGWGNHVVVSHGKGIYTRYAHLRPGTVIVDVGDRVEKGEVIGGMGNSGRSDERHLHFELGRRAAGFNPCAMSQSFDRVYNPELVSWNNAPSKPLGEIACPSGYTLTPVGSGGGRLCIDAVNDDAWGPFTEGMWKKCKASGGGAACDTNRWAEKLAVAFYGNKGCPAGAYFDDEVGYCAELRSDGKRDAFGPFPAWLVDKCISAGGGAVTCKSARWNRDFLANLMK